MALPRIIKVAFIIILFVLIFMALLSGRQSLLKSDLEYSAKEYVRNIDSSTTTVVFANVTARFSTYDLLHLHKFCEALALKAPEFLTHFPKSIVPRTWVGEFRSKVQLVFGMAIKWRPVVGYQYASKTLRTILEHMMDAHRKKSFILVLIAETEPERINNATQFLRTTFHQEINNGAVHLIIPHDSFYALYRRIVCNVTGNGPPCDYQKWRDQQNIDFAYLMVHGSLRAGYYMHLDDDMICDPEFADLTFSAIEQYESYPWVLAEVTGQGSSRGKMLRSEDALLLAQFVVENFDRLPFDWLLEEFFNKQPNPCASRPQDYPKILLCNKQKKRKRIGRKTDLCTHMGKFSSLQGKIMDDVQRTAL